MELLSGGDQVFTTVNLVIALNIFFARVCDVGLGTIRHVMIIRGKKHYAFGIAFFEALIWVYAISRLISTVQDPLSSVAFALGFASGTFVGMTIEGLFKIGEQVIRIFSRKGDLVADKLREKGYRVTVFEGNGRDGIVKLLFVQAKRRNASKITSIVRETDPASFVVLDDVCTVHVAKKSFENGAELIPATPVVKSEK